MIIPFRGCKDRYNLLYCNDIQLFFFYVSAYMMQNSYLCTAKTGRMDANGK